MATLGKIGEYCASSEEWPQYIERLEFFLIANKVTDNDLKRATFLSVIGPRTFKLLRNLITPNKPGDKSYEDLVKVLKDHFSPKQSEIVQRSKFYSRLRVPGENVSSYVAELRALADHCSFGSSLDTMIRDRLVCGINEDSIQKRLLTEGDKLTLDKAIRIAQSYETAQKDATELLPNETVPQPVHRIQPVLAAQSQAHNKKCYRCAKPGHLPSACRFKKERCHKCHKIGHIKRACTTVNPRSTPVSNVRHVSEMDTTAEHEYPLFTLSTSHTPPLTISVKINEKQVLMELDTGAAVSLVSEDTRKQHWPEQQLRESTARLKTYSGEHLEVLGSMDVEVAYGEQQVILPLLVVKGGGPSLFGRNWLEKIKLDWPAIHKVQDNPLDGILAQYQHVFQEGLGTLVGYNAQIQIDPTATPKFCKARTVPYAYRELVNKELDRLVEQGILTPVSFADWAAPIVPVLKSDKQSVRICGDFKRTVNQVSKVDKYPIPKIEDIFASLSGGKSFTTLDMSQAYQQLLLDEPSRKLVVINTLKGLFEYNRLPFGIASAPGIFQRVIDSLLQGIPGVVAYLDDILVTGTSDTEHLESLKEVLKRLSEAGLRLNRKKCQFLAPEVTYLGYRIDSEGLHPTNDKLRAVQAAPVPRNVTELKSYLGLLTYYGRFLPHLPSTLAPLYSLLHQDVEWQWNLKEQEAFKRSKELLLSSKVLVHFDPKLPVVLACDASSYGIGAVLAHKLPDGTEKPIGFASRTLSAAEKQYSQIEKEGLSCVFGVRRFHAYLIGRHFTLITDHKPLLSLFQEQKSIPSHASARIQRWALTLAAYEYTFAARSTTAHANADALSRLPLTETIETTPAPAEMVLTLECLQESPITDEQIRSWIPKDKVLSQVIRFIQQQWPEHCPDPELKPYWNRRMELTCFKGCIMWGSRVVIPEPGCQKLLQELHIGHPGICRMKGLARTVMWRPNIDLHIEEIVKGCNECQMTRAVPAVAPLNPLPWPSKPWSRIHMDYMGPFLNHMLLVIIDAGSKWIEVFPVQSSTAKVTIQHLKPLFAQIGLPDIIATDNGPCFVSSEFEDFLTINGIKHWRSSPYHPSSNGLAEKAVQIIKQGLKKIKDGSLNDRLARLLFSYRITPHSTTGVSPAELLMKRQLKSRFDLLKPNIATKVEQRQREQKYYHDSHAIAIQFQEGDSVYARDFRQGQSWLTGIVVRGLGPVSFEVKTNDGQLIRRHQDHLRKRSSQTLIWSDSSVTKDLPPDNPSPSLPR